jgi:hypothetical protein
MMTRRSFFQVAAGGAITLPEFEPKSTLRVKETPVPRAKFPAIDVHTHLFGLSRKSDHALLQQIAAWMDECNLQTMVNVTGGNSETLPAIKEAFEPFGKKFVTGVEPVYKRASDPGYPKWQADELAKCKQQGAVCLKILKSLGLGLRDRAGKLVRIDDPRFDPMWEAAGALKLPVLIHTSDPAAFFTPIDRFNERYEELQRHPEWSFYGKDFPKRDELLDARNRVVARHPKTTFIGLHVANSPEDLERVGTWFDRYKNLHCEIGARGGNSEPPGAGLSVTRTASCSAPTPRRTRAWNIRSRISAPRCTAPTSASWRRRTNTSTTRRPPFRRKDAGASTASRCRTRF